MKIKEKIPKFIPYIFIFIASIAICIPLFSKDLNIFRDDGIQHICRLMGTYQSIEEGQFFSVIMSNFCNGFGYSWNIFYSPITAYVPLILKIFNLTYTNCIKVFMFIVVFLSGVAMFKFTNKVTKNRNIAILAAILYILAPYKITDMYIRNALAELASFAFIPIIFNGLYTIINEEKKSFTLAFGAIGLILTHTIVTMYTAILCFIYVIVYIKKFRNKDILKYLIINLLFVILVTSFFWVPLLEHKLATNYEVFVPGRMERTEVLKHYKVKPQCLLYTAEEQTMVYNIGMINIVGCVLILLAYSKIPKEYRKIQIMFLIIGIVLTIMTLDFFPFEKLPSILKMIQFTFRLFEFTTFLFAFVAAVNIGVLIKNFKLCDITILLIISCLLLVPYKNKIEYKENDENLLWPAVNLTEQTGRVHAGMASLEYLPSKAFNAKEYIINREEGPIILNGEAQIDSYKKNGTNMSINIINAKKGTEIELPYIFYLGYNIQETKANGETRSIRYTESDNGFININIEEDIENVSIHVKYTGTTIMKITFTISIVTLFLVMFLRTLSKNRKF